MAVHAKYITHLFVPCHETGNDLSKSNALPQWCSELLTKTDTNEEGDGKGRLTNPHAGNRNAPSQS
ncbi:hypothetical protein ACRALDRAFT_2056719 [Sodiomyces alcalophilus JCM 7366]|uniref:uncharacterized protein n=1 Tax=Sodiomyces alcalophilus JCM 7366 TaxID=591952 RepID=UPI0039B68A2D